MKLLRNISILAFALLLIMINQGCKKNSWLDAKRIISDVKPETLKDFQALLDNTALNATFISSSLDGTDNIYVADQDFPTLSLKEQRLYNWQGDPWVNDGNVTSEWFYLYATIETANIVLDGINTATGSAADINNVKGQALFFRSIGYYNLAVLFCRQYGTSTAATDKGLPLRLNSDVTKLYQRSSLADTYTQILADCQGAIDNLYSTESVMTRPSKLAAYGLMAKVQLDMGNYSGALQNANSEINKNPILLNYNDPSISLNLTFRFSANALGNSEVLFYSFGALSTPMSSPSPASRANIDTSLYNTYEGNDLRKTYFFDGDYPQVQFRGCYTGLPFSFCGIANDEIYLIKAESEARTNNVTDAMATLNTLLKNRYVTGTYVDKTAADSTTAINTILLERRKELPFTFNTRWEDLKRLNKEGRNITVKRIIAGKQYILAPNSPRYALPIPQTEIQISGIAQNDY